MSFSYTLDQVSKLGDKDPKYGQRYWCHALEEELPVSFNTLEDIGEITETTPTIKITAEEKAMKKSKEYTDDDGNQKGGNHYWQLKKVKLGSQSRGENHTSPSATNEPKSQAAQPTLKDLYEQNKELLARVDTLTALITDNMPIHASQKELDRVIEDGGEIDLDKIPF